MFQKNDDKCIEEAPWYGKELQKPRRASVNFGVYIPRYTSIAVYNILRCNHNEHVYDGSMLITIE